MGDFCFDFKCDFLLLKDVKEYITEGYCCCEIYLHIIFMNHLLFHIAQKEKISVEIAAKMTLIKWSTTFSGK